jgi:hypothetical protein
MRFEMTVTAPEVDSSEEQKAVVDAVATIMKVASRPTRAGDASRFLVTGGVAALPDRQYVEELLEIVNYNLHESNAAALVLSGAKAAGTFFPRAVLDPLIELLDQIREDPKTVAAQHANRWREILKGRVITIPADHPSADDRTLILGDAAAWTHVLKVLTQQPLCDELCRCALPTCGRFFLYAYDRSGPPPIYCNHEGATCAANAKRQKTRDRVAAKRAATREGMSVKDYRAFKATGTRPRRRK